MRPSPLPNPSAPSAEPPNVTARGGSSSDSLTSARYRPFTGPMPMVTSARKCASDIFSTLWQPGITARSVSGSSSMVQTRSADAPTLASPSPRSLRPPPFASIGAAARPGGGAVSAPRTMDASFAGTSGNSMSSQPSASATALAMQTGVDMQLPSPTPFDPSGVNGDGVSM